PGLPWPRGGAAQWSCRRRARRWDRRRTGPDAAARRRRLRRSPARSAGVPAPGRAGRWGSRSRPADGYGHESPRGPRPVLWLDWMSLRVIRNSIQSSASPASRGAHGNDRSCAGVGGTQRGPFFAAAGHQFFPPTYTGLGERAHLAHHEIDLTTHINDVAAVLDCEDLKEVTLLGHSYGGMVATGVADKARRRIARVVYIDAFAPQDGQSLVDLVGPDAAENKRGKAMGEGAGWRIPPMPMPPDTAPEDVTWATPRRR